MSPELTALDALIQRKDREISELRDALDWYAQPSNWRREVRIAGVHRNWSNSRAADDKGARAKFALMRAGQ